MSQLPKRYDPLGVEEEILKFWEKENVYDKTLDLRSTGPKWNFLEGPPTTNGFMHVGHARGRAMKDTQRRYMTMRGYDVWRRGGWDMQGLPVELEVEKNEGIAEKGLIESDVTKSIGKGVPAHTDKKRDAISRSAAINIKLPINSFNLYFMLHPIPITNVYIFLDILHLC